MAEDDSGPPLPSLAWRIGSTATMGIAGALSRIFMTIPNTTKAHGKHPFMDLLDDREIEERRRRGLITGGQLPPSPSLPIRTSRLIIDLEVSNHISVIDDPLIWGVLPYRYHLYPSNHRWSLGSYDIVFKNKIFAAFFNLGQTLPTHRLQHSPHGGLFQPTMTEAVRLLSHRPFSHPPSPASTPETDTFFEPPYITDPFTSPTSAYTYTTNGTDSFPRPSAYATRSYGWIHIFPEGKVHQHPLKTMRYFKWGVARLILEPDVCPDIIPIWIEGTDQIMNEARSWPRFVPRVGKKCGVWFGDNVGGAKGEVYHELRKRWRDLVERNKQKGGEGETAIGVLDAELKYGDEAVRLREEVTLQIRKEVLEVRRMTGLPDEDPKAGLVETWREEGGKREGRMDDGSLVKDT